MDMSGQLNVEKVIQWIFNCSENGGKVNFSDIKALLEILGYSAIIEEKQSDFPSNNENVDPNIKRECITVCKLKQEPTDWDPNCKQFTDILKITLRAAMDIQNVMHPSTTSITPPTPKLFSPRCEREFNNPLRTSSPIAQQNKVTENLSKILALAKEAHELSSRSGNKMQKRISEISPLATSDIINRSVVDLNVTQTKDCPSVLKPTPTKKRARIVKPIEQEPANKVASNTSGTGAKKSFLQPIVSKLRTPTYLKRSIPSPGMKSTGTPNVGKSTPVKPERRATLTPVNRSGTTTGISRLKYPAIFRN